MCYTWLGDMSKNDDMFSEKITRLDLLFTDVKNVYSDFGFALSAEVYRQEERKKSGWDPNGPEIQRFKNQL